MNMARLHSRKKGRSGSKKPATKTAKAWVRTTKDEVKETITRLAKEGKTEAQIGQVLRDQYAVPSTKIVLGKTVSQLLKELKLAKDFPSDLLDLIRRAVSLRKHLKKNTRDKANRIKLGHIESKIKRLVRYYRGKKLSKDWKYDPEQAELLVK